MFQNVVNIVDDKLAQHVSENITEKHWNTEQVHTALHSTQGSQQWCYRPFLLITLKDMYEIVGTAQVKEQREEDNDTLV